VVLIDRGRIVAAGTIDELRSTREHRRLRVAVTGAGDDWFDAIPGVRLVDASADDGVVLELDDDVDEQRVLDLARGAGDVTHFGRERASLSELFREAVRA
jgi:ABC-2 type transport system ATP-binding protein